MQNAPEEITNAEASSSICMQNLWKNKKCPLFCFQTFHQNLPQRLSTMENTLATIFCFKPAKSAGKSNNLLSKVNQASWTASNWKIHAHQHHWNFPCQIFVTELSHFQFDCDEASLLVNFWKCNVCLWGLAWKMTSSRFWTQLLPVNACRKWAAAKTRKAQRMVAKIWETLWSFAFQKICAAQQENSLFSETKFTMMEHFYLLHC